VCVYKEDSLLFVTGASINFGILYASRPITWRSRCYFWQSIYFEHSYMFVRSTSWVELELSLWQHDVAWQLEVKLGVEFYDLQSLKHTQSTLNIGQLTHLHCQTIKSGKLIMQ